MLLSNSMRRLRSIAAVALCLVILCLCACSAEVAGEAGCLFLNGENVAVDWVLKINGKEFSPNEFDKCYTEFWQIIEPAVIRVFCPGGLAEGEHTIDVKLMFRSPYMAIGPDHAYMPVDSSGSKTLTIKD